MAQQFKIDDYTKIIGANMTRSTSALHDFPFTDSLLFDQHFETDSSPVYTAGLFRTSRGPDRVQLATFNELGAEQGGLYFFSGGEIATVYTLQTIFFYGAGGVLSGAIQQTSPGLLGISFQQISLIADDIILDGAVSMSGATFGGDFLPTVTASYDVGNSSFAWRNGQFSNTVAASKLFGNYLAIVDGVAVPTTVSGVTWIYVDVADGDLKVKFGDGTIKTISTD